MAEEPPQISAPAGPAMTTASLTLPHLLHPTTLHDTVKAWLREDTPSFDYGGYVVGEKEETAVLLCKSPGVIAGRPFFEAVFSELGCTVEWLVEEGAWLEPITRAAYVRGSVRHILLGERVALNCMARISGVATVCRALRELADKNRWTGQVAGTRKTTPGFRIAEKYGLLVGGVSTHRYDLSAMIMLKDNHIWSAGNITKAVQAARRVAGFSTKVEVECGSVEEATEAASAGADIVMLDNFNSQGLHIAARKVKAAHPHIMIEASGGITHTTLPEYFGPDIDIISLSATTQGYGVVDFSLKILKESNTISTK